jgi:hypothetical protein
MIDKTEAKRLRDQALLLVRSEGRASGNGFKEDDEKTFVRTC